MNRKIQSIIGIAALTLAMITVSSAWADPVTNTPNPLPAMAQATNYAALSYGDFFDKSHKIGGGALILYNINHSDGIIPGTAAGVGLDYAGEWRMVSGNFELKYTTHPLSFCNRSWITSIIGTSAGNYLAAVEAEPFGLVGGGSPLSGAGKDNGDFMTVEGTGCNLSLYTWSKGNVGGGYAALFRQNAGEDFNELAHALYVKVTFKFW